MSQPRRSRWLSRKTAALALALLAAGGSAWWGMARRYDDAARASISRAREALQVGRPEAAMAAIAPLADSGPLAADVLTIRGMALAAMDRPDQARPLLERSLALSPAQPMAAKVLAAVYFNDQDPDRGYALLDRAARLDPGDFRPWFARGYFLLRHSHRPLEAVGAFREALRRRPDDDGSRIGLAGALLDMGQVDELGPLIESLLRERPDDPEVLRLAAALARLQGRGEDVERLAGKALERAPDDPETLRLRASSRLQEGRRREALDDAERVAGVAPGDPSALELLARAEAALGLRDRAAATLARRRKALALSDRLDRLRAEVRDRPDDPGPRWRLGEAAADAGMNVLALKSFRAALALDSQCPPALRGLAALGRSSTAQDRMR